MKILLITEQREGKWNNVSFETLAAAQQIAQQTSGTLTAAVIGKGVAALADELAGFQLDEVLLVRARPARKIHARRLTRSRCAR